MTTIHLRACALLGLVAGLAAGAPVLAADTGLFANSFEFRPNILLVIMDDVGIDQMPAFGYGGALSPSMPSIDAIANDGLRFGNTWSMPECSPGRSVLMTGRYPLRNNVSRPWAPTTCQFPAQPVRGHRAVLRAAGYRNAMFGKFHRAGPEHNWAGNATPTQLGWDHFHG